MNSFLLDGGYDTDRNAFAIAVTPPMEAVQEFRIQSSLSPAPFAQSGGGVMDVITKSGGHDFHGNAFEYLRNEFSDAYYAPVELSGMYWHLVDLIWIFLYPLLYLA